ncbi:hypothetical protein TPA0598_03_05860 [Streptomyces lydicamycinicus]|uniref:Uncharacterized protein n=1 Tax=Streptomyces lydicamycinicus TaxID=1546107 RepID=A0A0P4R4X4_9ACTN|nr:hypothetical protein TPA0598_03_05860 [Streptomyces lydicamycinicus]
MKPSGRKSYPAAKVHLLKPATQALKTGARPAKAREPSAHLRTRAKKAAGAHRRAKGSAPQPFPAIGTGSPPTVEPLAAPRHAGTPNGARGGAIRREKTGFSRSGVVATAGLSPTPGRG